MSIQSIYDDFNAAAAAGLLSGDSPRGLHDLLGTLGLTQLAITGGTAGRDTDGAWLTAGATFLNTAWQLRLTGRPAPVAGEPEMSALSLRLAAAPASTPWTFAQAFPAAALPDSRLPVPDEQGGGVVLGPSLIAPLEVQQPALAAANAPEGTAPLPRLQGWLLLTDSPLAGYTPFLGATRLWMDGTVSFADPALPVLALRAPAPGLTLDLGRISLDTVGLELRNDYPDPFPLPAEGAPTSAALLFATVSVPTTPVRSAELTAPLLQGDYVWPLYTRFTPVLTLRGGVSVLSWLVGGVDAGKALPAGIPGLDAFGIEQVMFGVVPPKDGALLPTLASTSVSVVSTEPWNPPVPYLMIDQVGVEWMVDWGDPLLVTAAVFGTMTFGAKTGSSSGAAGPPPVTPGTGVKLNVRFMLPDQVFAAWTDGEIDLTLGAGIQAYFGTVPPDTESSLRVVSIQAEASLLRQTYSGTLVVAGRWPITAGGVVFNLDEVQFWVSVNQGKVSGQVQGIASIDIPGETPARLLVSALYPGDGHWEFEGGLFQGPLNLPRFAVAFLGLPEPEWMQQDQFRVDLTEFWARYSTAAGNPYSVKAKLVAALKDTVVGVPMSLAAWAEVQRRAATGGAGDQRAAAADGGMVVVGRVGGSFTVNRFEVGAAVSFGELEKTYTFAVSYEGVTLEAATSWVGEGTGRHQVLTVRLRGLTLGSVVRYFVGLANPNANLRLDPPWDFLDTITLDRFALVVDPTLQSIALTYDVDLTLPFLSLRTVGIRYDRSTGNPAVRLVLEGNFLGEERTGDEAISWDPVTQAPPAVPGLGDRLIDLRYLGMGQHVTPKGLLQYDSIADVLDAMRATMVPVDGAPPVDGELLQFDPASQWLLGVDVTVMDTVRLRLVLHDPDLYGVLVTLAGPEAGSLAGLSFELMYKKVTADIGVFHARLQIPDAFRQLQFGVVAVTLGVITVDIYTNGNFRVDLGFPHNRDFSQSFAVEAGYFNGHGGIYFGLLNGATSTRVPAITNGTFSPVIELGVGLMVGVGRTFEKGPLSAGLYVDLIAIFEGTLAWFHPTDAGAPTAMYYWCRGTAGIVGKLYGSVDFKVISVQVSVEAYATVTLTLAAHQSTLVELDVGVKVHASVKIFFVRISFSFDLTLQASFTIGEITTAPWTLAADQSGRGQSQLARSAHAPARRRPAQVSAATAHAYLLARFAPALLSTSAVAFARDVAPAAEGSAADGWHLAFDASAKVFPDGETRAAALRLVPALTVAGVPVDWSGSGTVPPNPDPDYQAVFLLTADSAVSAEAETLAGTHAPTVARSAHARTAAESSFNQVAEAMLRWSLNALGVTSPTATVTLGQLQTLVDQLALPEAENQGFTWENLDGFLGGNLHFTVGGMPQGDPAPIGGVPFPMPPSVSWTSTTLPPPYDTRDFTVYQPVDATYEAGVRAYFAPLDPRDAAHQPDGQARLALAEGDAAESMATFVFREYFLLAARAAAQAAVDLLAAFPYPVASTDSLALIAGLFPTTSVPYTVVPDDSIDHVASELGMSAAELRALNPGLADELPQTAPGTTLAVTVGVTPESIASANPGWPVQAGTVVTLGDLAVPVAAGDTFATLAGRYGVSADAWLQSAALLDAPGILRAGATLALPSYVYDNPNALSLVTVAAVFYVRLPVAPAGTPVPLADWYAEAIARLNAETLHEGAPLPSPLLVPTAYNDLSPARWTPLAGDTLDVVADTLALAQNAAAPGSPFATWLAAVQGANPSTSTGAAVTLPASSAASVAAGDTLRTLATRLLQDAGSASFRSLVAGADILLPLAAVVVPGATQAVPAGQTLVTLAQYHGLSLEDLAARAADDAGLLATDPAQPLTIPSVPALGLEALTAALHAGKPSATVAGQVARFMLNGLRLPAPVLDGGVYRATGPMTGLYALTGQQVPAPAPVGDPGTVLLDVTFTSAPLGWLTFADSVVTQEGDTVATLQARHAGLHTLNPALRTRAAGAFAAGPNAGAPPPADGAAAASLSAVPLPRGMIVMTAEAEALQVQLTQQQLADGYPATALVPAFEGEVRALPAGRQVPVRHPVTQPIRWRTTVAPQLPVDAGSTGTAVPALWLLPAELMGKAAAGESADAYRLEQVTPQAGPAADPAELGAYAWGTLVSLAIQRVPGSPGTVELFGADTADRQRLALLLDYLGVFPGSQAGDFPPLPPGETVSLTLAWQLPASAGTPDGLTTTSLAPASCFVVKANLSTETRSGPQTLSRRAALDEAPSTAPFASMTQADAPRFLALAWECSVVGGGGYWLHYEAPDGSPGIPDGIFDQDGRASLSLLVQLASQSSTGGTGWPVRNLFAFNNVAVVGDGVDPGSVALYASPVNPTATTPEASVQQGRVGFTLDLRAPAASGAPAAQQALQALYSLVGYQLLETAAFDGSDEGQPLAPEVHTLPDGTEDESRWTLMRVVPITRFARTPAVPSLPGFPPAEGDPYAGVTGASTPSTGTWVPASTRVQLWFHDVVGNVTAPEPPPESAGAPGGSGGGSDDALVSQVTVPVGYTDPLQGVGAWPATTLSYAVTAPPVPGEQPTAVLAVGATLQAVAYQPGGAEPAAASRARADRDRDRFARVYYQVMQADVSAGLLTSMQQAPPVAGVDSEPDLLPVSLDALRGYAAGSYALLSSLAAMGPYVPAGAPALNTVASTWGVDFEAIGLANAATPLGQLLTTTTLQVPEEAVFRTGRTVLSYCPSAAVAEDALKDADNVLLPLQTGTELTIPSTGMAVPDPSPGVTQLVDGFRCTIETLVAANAATAALLTPGFVFDCNGYTVTVAPTGDGADATLNGVAATFQDHWGQPYDAVTVVRMNADRPAMFRAGATLAVTGYVAQPGDTLQANGSGVGPDLLAPLNVSTPSVFPDGTPLYVQSTQQTLSSTAALGDTAAALGIAPGTLLRHNGAVATGASFAVPGLYGWPQDADTLRVPFIVRGGDTLEGIAAHFSFAGSGSAPALALVRMNADVPGTLAGGRPVTVGSEEATTQAGDSFQALADRFDPPVSLDALTEAIDQDDAILQPGALLLAPPAVLPSASGTAALTPTQAAAPFGVTPAQLLGANAGTPGLLVPGVALAASTALPRVVEVTAPRDSVTALLRRFGRRGVATSIDALVQANAGVAFLTPGAPVLLPPADTVLTATLGGFDPQEPGAPEDAPWKFPGGIFPVHVWVQLQREWALVNPDLRGTQANPAAAARVRTAVPAARQGLPGDRTDGGAVTLTGFATALEAALPPVRVATGKVLSEQDEAAGTDVWAVIFSDARIRSVTVTPPATVPGVQGPQPRTFALRPLANTLSARSGVELQSLDTATGTLTGSETLSFQGVDLEVWAQSFLAAVDLLLSVQYAPGAYVINPGALQTIVTAKQTLAAAVAAGLDSVVAGQSQSPESDRAAAVEALRQQLLASLSRGYAASAVLQYDVVAQTPWSTGYARFSGASDITFGSQDPQLKLASVSNGKVSLRSGDSRVNLVVYVPDVQAHETLPMTLDFRLVEMEFNVATEIEGYDRSDWLTFVNPVVTGSPEQVQVELGAPVVPLALRAYPPMPTLLDHHADTPHDPATVADAVHWAYRVRLQHQSAEQDEIELRVEMNRRPLPGVRFALDPDDLFGWLAQYNSVAVPLLGLLGGLQEWAKVTDRTVVSNALDTFASLATGVACAWCGHWGVPRPDACTQATRAGRAVAARAAPSDTGAQAPPARDEGVDPVPTELYAYTMSLLADETSTYYATLAMTRTEAGGPVGWPAITCYGPDGVPHLLEPGGDCGCATGDDGCRCYTFPPESRVPAFSLLTFELSWGPLHVARYQSAISTVWVTRNASLFGPGGPPTTEAFVYQTPQSSYAEPVVPFVSVASRLDIGRWSYDPASTPLVPLFATMFDDAPAGRTIALGVRYGYRLAAGDPPLESYLPVKQSAAVPYDAALTVPGVCAALEAWFTAAEPVEDGGSWVFWVDMYSTVDPALRRPVLQLKRLVSPLESSAEPANAAGGRSPQQ